MKYRLSSLIFTLGLTLSALPARAQEAPRILQPEPPAAVTQPNTHSRAFPILASTFAAINALDVYTTTRAVRSGAGTEMNPIVSPVADNPAAYTALKAVSTASTIFLARQIWKQHPKGAIAFLICANVGMGVIVSHNAMVLAGH